MANKTVTTDTGGKVKLTVPPELGEKDQQLAVKAMDQMDEKMIVEELVSGRASDKDVYVMKDTRITGLSIIGVRRLFENTFKQPPMYDQLIRESIPNPEKPGSFIHVRAIHGSTPDGKRTGFGEVGQPEYTHRRDGSWLYNVHCIPIALAKAKRNCIKDLLSLKQAEDYLDALLSKKGRGGRVQTLTAADAQDAKHEETPRKIALRARLFAIASHAISVNTKEGKDKVVAFVEKACHLSIAAMSEDDLMKAGNDLQAFATKAGKENFAKAIIDGEVPSGN